MKRETGAATGGVPTAAMRLAKLGGWTVSLTSYELAATGGRFGEATAEVWLEFRYVTLDISVPDLALKDVQEVQLELLKIYDARHVIVGVGFGKRIPFGFRLYTVPSYSAVTAEP